MTSSGPEEAARSREQGRESRAPRDSVMLSVLVERRGGGATTRHRVRDLSPGGVRIDQAAALQVGATVLVTIGAIEAIGATVAWVRESAAGLTFDCAINPDDARAKAALAPRPADTSRIGGTVPTAGWIPDLASPYRR